MQLRFIQNFRILEVVQATQIELEQLATMTTSSGWDWKRKEKWTSCLMQQNRYIPGGFWKDIMSLSKAKKPWTVQIDNLKDLLHNIDQDEFLEWLSQQPFTHQPRWYQAQGAYLAIKYRISRGQFATSAGKSFIQYIVTRYLLDKILDKGQKVLMIVPSVMLVRQMASDVASYATDDYITVDQVFGGSKRNKEANLVVGNIDSLANRDADFFEQFGAILVDEAHKLTTKSYQQVISWVPNNSLKLIYSVSGTYHEDGTYDSNIQKMYSGPILIDVGAKQLMDESSVTPLKIKVLNLRYDFQTSSQYYHFDGIDEMNTRNHAEIKFIRQLHVRFAKIANTVAQIQGNQLLLFKSVEYCQQFKAFLEQQCPDKEVFQISGSIDAVERERIRLRTEEIDCAIICATYQTMSTGVSIKRLQYLHLIESAKSFIMVRQSIGRSLRLHPDKEFAIVIDYVDIFKKHDPENWPGGRVNICQTHGKARQKIYDSEKFEYKIINLDV